MARFPQRLLGWPAGLTASTVVLATLTTVLAASDQDTSSLLDVALLFLLVALVSAAVWGYIVGLYAALLADLLVNFFFVPPLHTLNVQETHNVVVLLLFLAVAAVGASMLALLRRQVAVAQSRTVQANALLELNQTMAAASTPQAALRRLCEAVTTLLRADGCAVLRLDDGWSIAESAGDEASAAAPTRDEASLADAALRTRTIARRGGTTNRHLRNREHTTSGRRETFIPFPVEAPERGVLRLVGVIQGPAGVDAEQLLLSFAAEASVALHRANLATEAERAESFRRSDELKSLLLSSLSHDLRSPLTAVKAAVGNLRDASVHWSGEDIAGFLLTIEDQTDRLTATVNDLMQLSRLEAGVVSTTIEPVQVALLLRDAAQAAAPLTRGRHVDTDAESSLWVAGDYRLMSQALANLIENANRYSVAAGEIRLTARRSDGMAWIAVGDDGPPIPAADQSHLFDRFFRGAAVRGTGGNGLGLSIVQAIAQVSGGSVAVRSSARGNELAFSVPTTEAPV